MAVLITFIGKGKKEDGSKGYERKKYNFDGQTVETSCFAHAIINSGLYIFEKLILIGTYSSSWGEVIDTKTPDGEDFFLNFEDRLEKTADENGETHIDQVLLDELKDWLIRQWNISDVQIIAHPASLPGNEDEIVGKYFRAVNGVSGDIILDVTHSFRWMPLLMQPVISVVKSLETRGDVTVVYGEINSEKASRLTLDACNQVARHANEIREFFERWDATPLVESLQEAGQKSVAKAIKRLADYLGGNFFVPLVIPLIPNTKTPFESVRAALASSVQKDFAPWLQELRMKVEVFCNMFDGKKASEKLLLLAEMYAARKLFAQALQCQEVCLSIFAWERAGEKREQLNYENLKELRDDFTYKSRERELLRQICNVRNAIAHGAADKGEIETVKDLPRIFKMQQSCLARTIRNV